MASEAKALNVFAMVYVGFPNPAAQREIASGVQKEIDKVHDAAAETAGKASAAFMGNPALINETKALLLKRHELDDLTIRQLEKVLLLAAEQPMTNPKLTQARIEAETKQASTLNGFEFKLDGQPISVNEIDNLVLSRIENKDDIYQSIKDFLGKGK